MLVECRLENQGNTNFQQEATRNPFKRKYEKRRLGLAYVNSVHCKEGKWKNHRGSKGWIKEVRSSTLGNERAMESDLTSF